MHNSKIKRISLAVCFALLPMAAGAAGLGKLTVISGLGEPLNAEVELSATKDEISSIAASIASADIYENQGVERASALTGVRIDVVTRPDGVPVLRLVSSQPINDPFLDMLIQVEWASGRLLREYTALLDPPGYGDNSGTSTAQPAAGLPEVDALPGSSSAKPRKSSGVAPGATKDEIVVQKGDTLRAIAAANQVEGVSLEQMLVGLYRANESAFAGKNMNRLKVGQIIKVPPQEELQAVTQGEAVKEIRVQSSDWNAYRNKLAGMVAESAPAQEAPSAQTASGKITAPAEDKSAPMEAGPRDVVKLSKGETGDLKGKLTALQEEATAREKAVKESSERVAMLEKQLQDMQKLLEIKNQSLADAQSSAKPAPPPPPSVSPAEPTAAPAEPPKSEPVAEQPQEPAAPAAEAKPEEKPPVKKPRKIVRPAPPTAAPVEPGLLENPLLLAGGGGLLALLGGAWFFLRNKRRKGLDSFEQGILTTGGLKPNTVFGNTAGGTVDTGNTSFLTDFGQGNTSGMIDTNDVDPIAEAEVYMAYGRDVQAEEILKDAIAKEPKRHELHLKLLEIFANRKDSGSFETLAGELYASLGATDPTWAKVAEMGRGIEPNNPLYGDSGTHAAPAAAPVDTSMDFDATIIQRPPSGDEPSGSLDIGLGGPDTTLDFSLDEPSAPVVEASVAKEESNDIDFDIGGLEMPEAEPVAPDAEEAGLPDLDAELASSVELDLPLLGEETPAQASLSADEPAGLDIPLELPEAAAAENTQLDVAELGMEELGMGDLPSLEPAAPAVDETVAALDLPVAEEALIDNGIGLDLPELELPDLEVGAPTASAETPEVSLDVADLDVPAAESVEIPQAEETEEISLDIPDDATAGLDIDLGDSLDAPQEISLDAGLDLELPEVETVAPASEAAQTEPTEEAGSGLDFNFDVDLGETPEPIELDIPAPVASEAPALDLTDISLDLGEASDEAQTEEITLDAANESPDVDTKLDLVTAYIDMGDQEGARELLQEVLNEGGPSQKAKAQKLLDGLV